VLREFLQAKLYPIRVTGKSLEYEGSLGLSRRLIKEAGLVAGERVLVVNLANGERFETYLIEEKNEGACWLKGGAARLGEIGDRLIVMAFAYLEASESITPRIIRVDSENNPLGNA